METSVDTTTEHPHIKSKPVIVLYGVFPARTNDRDLYVYEGDTLKCSEMNRTRFFLDSEIVEKFSSTKRTESSLLVISSCSEHYSQHHKDYTTTLVYLGRAIYNSYNGMYLIKFLDVEECTTKWYIRWELETSVYSWFHRKQEHTS